MQRIRDADDAGIIQVDAGADLNGTLNSLAVVFHIHRHMLVAAGRQRIGVCLLRISLVDYSASGHICCFNTDEVAVGGLGEVEYRHALGCEVRLAGVVLAEAAGDVGIHTVAADILSYLIYDQNVRIAGKQPGHLGFCVQQQAGFFLPDTLRRQSYQTVGLVIGVLNDGQAKEDIGMIQHGVAEQWDEVMEILEAHLMYDLGLLLLA